MNTDKDCLFLQLLRIALGNADEFDSPLSAEEWEALMEMSAKQGVSGVTFSGVEKLPKEQMPPLEVIMDWVAVVSYTENENRRLNDVNVKLHKMFERDGKRACIMKGVSMGVLYPEPLRRNAGDVDVWMAGGYRAVEEYVRRMFPDAVGESHGHHLAFKVDDTSVEVHFLPADVYNFWHNRRLRNYYKKIEAQPWNCRVRLGNESIVVSEPDVALVIAFVHLFHHWAFEGAGMKQVLDCYWLLLSMGEGKEAEEMKKEAMRLFRKVGIGNFVAALMYVMRTLGMEESQMLCAPNEKSGALLLNDILSTGIVSAEDLANGKYGNENKLHKFFRRLHRVVRMMPVAPSEMPWVMLKNVYGWMLGRTKAQ